MAFQGYADFNHLQNVMRENTQNSDEKKTKEKSAKTGLAASAPGGTTKKKEGKKKKATKAGSAATTSKMLSTQTGETLNAVTTAPTGKKKPKKGKKYGFGNCDGDAGTKSTTKKGGVGKKKTSAAPGSSTKEKETEKQKQKRKKLLQQKRKKDSADEQFDGFGDDGDWSDGDGGDAAGAGSVASTNALGIPPLLASSSGKIGVGTSAAAAEPSLVGMTPAAATAVVGVTTLDSVVDSVVDATANSNNSAAVGLDASGSGVGGGGGRRNQERFVASTIRLGRATQAAAGLPDLMGYTDMSLLRLIDGHGDGIEAIMNEVNTSGSEEDKANLRGLLDGSYSNPPSGKDASPTPGELAPQAMAAQVRQYSTKTEAEVSMESKLTDALDGPGFSVVVEDQSGGCGAQYVIECESIQFKGLNTIKQHRLVSSILKEEVAAMHAVRIFTSVPEPEE
eukprot:gene6973-5681_t